ncbi:tetratricopeptide repeat protein [Planctomicrobium piriforme]|uniref:MerR HTH family regulatory protein n=1 Tax=Planctomicrobium piriforme TaxID=1576369 RepID=A0A1I3J062_9PLAN|nr:tetratricopeptide repeat protein [Planctomicrobium piriforme]SFI53358.1 MerR HTH family regulatory protein [Planctomicrobium piriforme]
MAHAAVDQLPSGLASSPCLQGERVAFTGTLASMTHAQAAALVAGHGGAATDHVSRQTTMLVIGEEGWPLDDNGQPSVKLQQVERWRQDGVDIQLLNETHWLSLLGLNDQREEVHRLYTPAMLSSILGLSVHVIRGWARVGLIRPVRMVYRLPYFDFREVSSARRLSDLLQSGVPRKDLEESLKQLPGVQRGDERPLEQLQILAHQLGVVIRDDHGLVMAVNGQRLLDFDDPTDAADVEVLEEAAQSIRFAPPLPDEDEPRDWLVEGCRLYDADRLREALEAFRRAALSSPRSADVHFQIGECLYRMGQTTGALERYYAAVEHDHDFLEAWTQIGCLHRELGDLQSARSAFQQSLKLLPEYPDAHFHLAETLYDLGDDALARVHWAEYLQHDSRGPWADIARQRLEGVDFDE